MTEALLLENGTDLAGTSLDGPVLLPVIVGTNLQAASKKREYQRVQIAVAIPADLCPDPGDVSWLSPGRNRKLRRVFVVMEFEPGTFGDGVTGKAT